MRNRDGDATVAKARSKRASESEITTVIIQQGGTGTDNSFKLVPEPLLPSVLMPNCFAKWLHRP
jgi:hypothetical protein